MRKVFFIFIILNASTIFAVNRYVATTGADVGDCSLIGSPCLTLQYAIDQSLVNDTINVAAGTYSVAGLITVNKTLTLLGAQNGVDARTRLAAESILSNTQGIYIAANNVVVDGFTIQDSSNNAFTGYGIAIAPNMNGTQIVNNIFRNNISGLGLANLGVTECLVQHNLFENNNLPGPAGGTGIYTDESVGQATIGVLINENAFEDNDVAAIGFSSSDSNFTSSNITITNNTINN